MTFLHDNLATIIVGLLLLAAVVFAVKSLLKERKQGGCSGGCAGCSCAGSCSHKE